MGALFKPLSLTLFSSAATPSAVPWIELVVRQFRILFCKRVVGG